MEETEILLNEKIIKIILNNGILVIQKNEVLYIKYISDKDLPYSTGNLKVKVLVTQWCPTFCDSMDCSPRGSSVHGILQARVLEGETILFFRGSSQQSKLDLPHCRKILYHLSHQGTSSTVNAKKWRKTIERERLVISSRKLEIPREHFMQRWAQ